MDIVKARKIVTNTLDDVEADGADLIVTFRSAVNQTAVTLLVNPNNTFRVGRSTTSTTPEFLDVADAYTRAAVFVRHAGLKTEPSSWDLTTPRG